MKKVFEFFWKTRHIRPFFVLMATMVVNVLQGISFVMLLPVITMATETGASAAGDQQQAIGVGQKTNLLMEYTSDFVEWLGLEPSLSNFFSIMVSFYLMKLLLQYVLIIYISFMTMKMQGKIWSSFLVNLIGTSWSFFKRQSQGLVIDILNRSAILGQLYSSCVALVSTVLQSLVIVVILAFVSFTGLQLMLGFLLANIVALKISERFNLRANEKIFLARDYMSKKLSDLIVAMKTIKIMGRSDKFTDFFSIQAYFLARRELKAKILADSSSQFAEFMIFAGTILLIVIQIFHGFSSAEFIIFIILFFRLSGYIKAIQGNFVYFTSQWPSYMSILRLMDEATRVKEKFDGRAEPIFNKEIKFDKLDFSFDNKKILREVSVSFPKDCTTVLYGPSGSGKTTLIDLMCGLYDLKSRSLFIDGTPIEDIDIVKWRRKIGYVPQDIYLLNSDLRDNITLGLEDEISDERIWEVLRQAHLYDYVKGNAKGLSMQLGEKGVFLSGGERQRVALARALVFNPDILILDEVTSNLDPQSEISIYNNIKSLPKSYTIVIITHRDIWLKMADRKYEVSNGTCTRIFE